MPEGFEAFVEAVPGEPLPHGLLGGCVPIVDATDPHQLLGTQNRSVSGVGTAPWEWCPPGDNQPASKTFTRAGFCTFNPVTIYAGTECSAPVMTFEESKELSLQTLELGASRALEEWFMRNVLCSTAVDLTPATATDGLSAASALSTLENWLGVNYGGRGLIHAPAGMGAQFGRDTLAMPDWCGEDLCCLRTLTGNGLVLGSGYSVNVGPPDCTVAPSGQAWIYATGPLRIRRDQPNEIPPERAMAVNRLNNDQRTLVEQTFVIEGAICDVAAVRAIIC